MSLFVLTSCGVPAMLPRGIRSDLTQRSVALGEAAEALHGCCTDDVPRVRSAAVRALARVGEAEDADAVRDCLDDPETAVAAAAERALREMSRRLDRPL